MALLTGVGECVRGGAPRGGMRGGIEAIAVVFLDLMERSGPLVIAAVVLIVSAAVGAVMGLFAARLLLSPSMRAVVLALASVPALWLVIAGAWAALLLPRLIEEPGSAPWILVAAFLYSGVSILAAAPVLVTPAVLAAALLEGWARPEPLPQTGLARPLLRRRVLWVLVMLAAALTTFAALRWERTAGSCG